MASSACSLASAILLSFNFLFFKLQVILALFCASLNIVRYTSLRWSSSLLFCISASCSFCFLAFSAFSSASFYCLYSSLAIFSLSLQFSNSYYFFNCMSSLRFSSSFLNLTYSASASAFCFLNYSSLSFFSSCNYCFLLTSAALRKFLAASSMAFCSFFCLIAFNFIS